MSNEELNVSRGEGESDDPAAALKAHVEAQFAAALEQESLELGETPIPFFDWEIYAFGPFQALGMDPGRIIKLGQIAYIATVVWMNHPMCMTVAGFQGKVELTYWTSNTQSMAPVPAMNFTCCIPITLPGCDFFVHIWEFEPTEAACILETNICARICNCNDHTVPGYAGFVRHCYNLDPEFIFFPLHFHPAGFEFDRPIRYLVYRDEEECDCAVIC